MKGSNSINDFKYVNGSKAYGYKYNGPKLPYSIDVKEAFMVREIFDLYRRRKMSPKAIAEHLNNSEIFKCRYKGKKWTAEVIKQILTNEVYVGTYVYNKRKTDPKTGSRIRVPKELWCRVKNHHEPIISNWEFEEAQEIYEYRGNNSKIISAFQKEVIEYLSDDDAQIEITRLLLTKHIENRNFDDLLEEVLLEQDEEIFGLYREELLCCMDESNVVEYCREKALRMLERL